MRQHATAPGLGAHKNCQRIKGREAGDANGGLDFGEATQSGFGRVGRQQGRMLAPVGHVA